MKVVHITTVHSALDGRIFRKQCRALARAGFQVTSVGPHSGDATIDQVQIKSIRKEPSRLARMSLTAWRAYREALRLGADVYHFHDPELIPVGLLLRRRGKHVIYDLHEDYPKDVLSKTYLPTWSRRSVSWTLKQLEGAACRRFSALVAATPSIAERFKSKNHNVVVIHNYPDPEEVILRDTASTWEARRQSVAYIGGISRQRGLCEMVQAMGAIPESLAATLELAGPMGREDIQLEELRALPGWQRVRYHGLLELPRAIELLQSVRAGLVLFHPEPNHIEAMPQKIFEYMGAGLPVIASDFRYWRQLFGDTGCALFVDPRDTRAISQAIEYVLTHPDKSLEMGLRGQAAVVSRFNWNSEAEKLVQLYSRLAETRCVA